MIVTVTLNPAVDHTVLADHFAMGQLNRVKDLELHPGGKGINVAIMLGVMGVDVIATGFMGRNVSRFMQESLHKYNVTTNFIHINESTRHNYFIIDEASNTRTLLDEEGPSIDEDEVRNFKDNFKRILRRADFVILAGSIPKNLDCTMYCELIDMANEAGVKTIINTEERNLMECLDRNPYIVVPDTRSSEKILGKKIDPGLDIKTAACQILGSRSRASLLTFDYESYIVSTSRGCWEAISPKVEIRSRLKSGDGMIAGLAYGLLKNSENLHDAIRWGLAASAAASAYRCRFIKTREEVENLLDQVIIKEV